MKSCSVFLLIILAVLGGIGLGLLFGWVIWPVQWTDASPANLRTEFQSDWMNMAIDSYSVNQMADLATERYSYLGEQAPIILDEIIANPTWVTENEALAYQQAVTGSSASTATVPVEEATETNITSRILKPPLLGYVLVVLFLALLAIVLLVILVIRLMGGDKKAVTEPAAAVVATETVSELPVEAETMPAETGEPVPESGSRADLAAAAVAGAAVAAIVSDEEEPESAPEAGLSEATQETEPQVEEIIEEAPIEPAVEETEGGISAAGLAVGAGLVAGIAAAASAEADEPPATESVVAEDAVTGVDWALEEPAEESAVTEPGMEGAGVLPLIAAAGIEGEQRIPEVEATAEEPAAVELEDQWVPEDTGAELPSDFYGKYNRKVIDIEGIGDVYAQRLADAGITTTHALLQQCATVKGRQDLADKTGISGKLILEWANHADMMRIQGIGPQWSDLLEMVGVNTVREMALRNPANLHQALVDTNAEKNLVRQLPTPAMVEDWIEQAKELPRILTY